MTGICHFAYPLAAAGQSAAGPVIDHAALAAGHDGLPELILRLRFPDGGESTATLDNATGVRLMALCGAARVEDLAGHSWRRLLQAATEV